MVASKPGLPSWMSAAAATKLDFEGKENMLKEAAATSYSSKILADVDLGFGQRAFAAAGAAAISAVIVNPLDVAKVFNFFYYHTHFINLFGLPLNAHMYCCFLFFIFLENKYIFPSICNVLFEAPIIDSFCMIIIEIN